MAGTEIPDIAIDRAHWIGKGYTGPKTKKDYNNIVVRFTTFRHKTIVYTSKV